MWERCQRVNVCEEVVDEQVQRLDGTDRLCAE